MLTFTAVIALLFPLSHAQEKPSSKPTVEKGDLVTANYAMRLEDGRLIYTNVRALIDDPEEKKSDWLKTPEQFGPVEVMAGDDPALPELADGVIGMVEGQKKTITLPPEKGFGQPDEKKILSFPCEKRVPRLAKVTPMAYVQQFKAFPVVGKEVNHAPYFKSKITEVKEDHVVLEALVDERKQVENDYGVTTIDIDGDDIVVTLSPKIGAAFEYRGHTGRISASDGTTFSVDYNHPAAGRNLLLDIEILDVQKTSEFADLQIPWIEDYEEGFARAKAESKPAVLVLYAQWCSWSRKTLETSFEDPRVKRYRDQFVFVKVDSDEHKAYKELYDQSGFPLIVLLDADWEVVNKLDGYRDAAALQAELKKLAQVNLQAKVVP
jgi:FKBP-type peptidyl-prolyl cis-trans isomerase 2